MIYCGWFRREFEDIVPGYEHLQELDKGLGLYNIDASKNITLIHSGNLVSSNQFKGNGLLYTVFGKKINSIEDFSFFSCHNLSKIFLARAISIGASCFSHCNSLTEVSLPKATSIGSDAFKGCYTLPFIHLPEAVTIGSNAFAGCYSLTEVSLPKATFIGSDAFKKCNNLTRIFCKQGMKTKIREILRTSGITKLIEIKEV